MVKSGAVSPTSNGSEKISVEKRNVEIVFLIILVKMLHQ
jgi:hypothetical protein